MKRKSIAYITIGLCLCVISFFFLMHRKPNSIETALRLSGSNRAELEKILEHYSKSEADSLKLRAARFLISNCYIHSSQSAWFEDYTKKKIDFFPPQYGTSAKAKSARDSLQLNANLVSTIKHDCQELNSSYLIAHIDSMVSIWQSSPWKSKIKFNQFCRYILPYRVLNEPQSLWPNLLAQKYKAIADSARDIVSAAKAVNEQLAQDIKYNGCWVLGGIGLQSIPELIYSKSGMCDDLAVYGVCAMRACGIPSTVDFTIWAKTNMGHSWGVIFDEEGKPISFGPGEQNPGEHIQIFSQRAYRRLAKVFRRSYQINYSGLLATVPDIQTIPLFFRQTNISDVTSEYIKVSAITVPISAAHTKNNLAYICVFNSGEWTPIHWSKIKDMKAVFSEMGDGLLYMVCRFDGNQLIPITSPFIYDTDLKLHFLDNNQSIADTVVVKKSVYGVGKITPSKQHQLFKWKNDEWELCYDIVAGKDSSLILTNMDEQTLYKFENRSRPFTVKNKTIIGW